MKLLVKDLKAMLANLDDDVEVKIYVTDKEYDSEGYDHGYGYVDSVSSDCIFISINNYDGKWDVEEQ